MTMSTSYSVPNRPTTNDIINHIAQRISELERSSPVDALTELHRLMAYVEGRVMNAEDIEVSKSLTKRPFLRRCTNLKCREPLNIRVPLLFKDEDMIAYCPDCQTRNVYKIADFYKRRSG